MKTQERTTKSARGVQDFTMVTFRYILKDEQDSTKSKGILGRRSYKCEGIRFLLQTKSSVVRAPIVL